MPTDLWLGFASGTISKTEAILVGGEFRTNSTNKTFFDSISTLRCDDNDCQVELWTKKLKTKFAFGTALVVPDDWFICEGNVFQLLFV